MCSVIYTYMKVQVIVTLNELETYSKTWNGDLYFNILMDKVGREMAQQLRVDAELAGNWSLPLSTHVQLTNTCDSSSRAPDTL